MHNQVYMTTADKHERRQRVRIGLTGLAFVFLLVLLGTAISKSSDESERPAPANTAMKSSESDEPLAQIGAAPGAAKSDDAGNNGDVVSPDNQP